MCQDKWSDGMFVSHKIQTDAKLCKPIKESNDLAPNRLRRQPDALRLSRPAGLSVSCLLGPGVTDFDEITVASKLLDSRICHLATQWKDPFLPCWALCGISIEDQVYCHLVISLYPEHFTSTIHLLSLQVSQNSKGACSGRARPPEISWENCSRHLFQTNLKNAVLFRNYRMQIFFRMKAAMWRIWQIILLPQTCCQLGAGTHFGIAFGRGSGRAGPWSRPWWIWKRAQTGRQHGHRHENTVFSSFHHFFNFVQRFFQWFFLTISPLSVFFYLGRRNMSFCARCSTWLRCWFCSSASVRSATAKYTGGNVFKKHERC